MARVRSVTSASSIAMVTERSAFSTMVAMVLAYFAAVMATPVRPCICMKVLASTFWATCVRRNT